MDSKLHDKADCPIQNQFNSSIGRPLGSTGCGRPELSVYCTVTSMPRWRYMVASTSCGDLGLSLGKAPRESESPTTRPPLTRPPARAARKTLGQWSRPASLLTPGVRPTSPQPTPPSYSTTP